MAVQKDRVFLGDTYKVSYECVVKNPDPRVLKKDPIAPSDATVMLWNVTEQEFVPLGATEDDLSAPGMIDENVVSFLLEGDLIPTDGDYKIFTHVFFSDGQLVTNVQPFKVLPLS